MRIFNVKWTSTSAGPSPDNNKRTEIFLSGCKMAMDGHPCVGCFNPTIWNPNNHFADVTPNEAAKHIIKYAPNKYITFVGGEPLDQIADLAETCRLLKQEGYHIIVISHYTLNEVISPCLFETNESFKLLENIDILVDGKYDRTRRIWDEDKAGDGLHDVVGSANQIIWDVHNWNPSIKISNISGYPAGALAGVAMRKDNELVYITIEDDPNKDEIHAFAA